MVRVGVRIRGRPRVRVRVRGRPTAHAGLGGDGGAQPSVERGVARRVGSVELHQLHLVLREAVVRLEHPQLRVVGLRSSALSSEQ